MPQPQLDEIDIKILRHLQDRARIPNVELADMVGLSAAPCLRRVRALEEAGVIQKYVTLLDPSAVNLGVTVFVQITLDLQVEGRLEIFEQAVARRPEVLECYLMTGDADYLLRVVVPDVSAYERFLRDSLTRIESAAGIKSSPGKFRSPAAVPALFSVTVMEMRMRLCWAAVLGLTVAVATADSMQQQSIQPAPIPHQTGQGVTPSFEGWYPNPDGTFSLSFGYFNRNYQETLDIPVGSDNRFEPGPPDRGQPTHFLTRRHTGLFTVVVPKDFGSQKLTWTIVANGESNSIPGHLRPEWEIDALKETTSGNTPPVIRFDPAGKTAQGPGGLVANLDVAARQPATLTVWASDDGVRKREAEGRAGPGLGVVWSKYRGPGTVTFAEAAPRLDGGKATTSVRFGAPGDYMLRVLAWDASGPQGSIMAGGFQCCWTNGYVKVKVSESAESSR